MKWIELSVRTPSEYVEPLSQLFHRHGEGGVAVEQDGGYDPDDGQTAPVDDWATVLTYLPQDSTAASRRNQIDLGVRLVAHVASISPLRERVVEEDEWNTAWTRHFNVLHIGQRTVIVPSWREYKPREDEAVISLDPGMAFGTGHHPTTKMCLEQLERLTTRGARVLDVGCGSGILCIAASKYGADTVLGLDRDPMAVKVARSNLGANSIADATIEEGSVPHAGASPRSFDVVVANISATVISELAVPLVAAVRPGGLVLASGILEEKMPGVARSLTSAGASIDESFVEGDWVAMVASVPR